MYLHPLLLLIYFVHEQGAPSFVLTRFLSVYKGNLTFEVAIGTLISSFAEVASRQTIILDLGSIAERQTAGTSELNFKQTY